jgi:hypothetical protein
MAIVYGLLPLAVSGTAGAWYYGSNKHTRVGYAPVQPVEYSHKLHAGELGIDCRYCHSTVERAALAAVPSTETCMNCHAKVRTDSPKLQPVRDSYTSDKPLQWVKVHVLAGYVYFDHSAHLSAGVGCSSCHGRVDQMPRVQQVEPFSMSWCIDCHRNPAPNLRDHAEITKMDWSPPGKGVAVGTGTATLGDRTVHPPLHCSGCHR